MSALTKAKHIAILAHADQEDKAGAPYWKHPEAVARWVETLGGSEDAILAAWLHDVLEDSTWTTTELLLAGIPERAVALTEALTHPKHQPRDEYIQGILDHPDPEVALVKFADTLHNLQPDRIMKLGPADYDMAMRKYPPVLKLLAQHLWP